MHNYEGLLFSQGSYIRAFFDLISLKHIYITSLDFRQDSLDRARDSTVEFRLIAEFDISCTTVGAC